MSEPFKILFKYPSRGRPERFFHGMDNLIANIADVDHFHISCTLDTDDPTMNNPETIERINQYPNTSIAWGLSKTKIDACNRSMPDYDWDILVLFSDDMRFNMFGFDQCIRIDMNTHFPDLDGLLHYPDQDAKSALATMYIAGRKFYNFFGYIYNDRFWSLWCDNLVMDIAIKLGKYFYCGYNINIHLCPGYGHLPKDEMYLEQEKHWEHDETIYNEIKARGYDLHLLKINL